ncbi:unnamed protein product, partial [marine sediment metagenome]
MASIETQICNRLHKLRNYIKGRVGTGEVAEDLYGEALLKILKKAKSEKIKKDFPSLDTFMWLCARTVISDHFKTEAVRKRLLEDDYVYCVNMYEKSPEKIHEVKEEIKTFMEEVRQKLNNVYRKTLILLLFQNMNHDEIANTLAIPRATISTYLLRM